MKAFITGLGIGTLLGIAYAPARGEQTRSKIGGRAQELGQTARARAQQMREQIERAAETVRKYVPSKSADARNESQSRAEESVFNTATRQQLMTVYGVGSTLADRIIEGRPYNSERDVLRRGIVTEVIFNSLRQELQDNRKSA